MYDILRSWWRLTRDDIAAGDWYWVVGDLLAGMCLLVVITALLALVYVVAAGIVHHPIPALLLAAAVAVWRIRVFTGRSPSGNPPPDSGGNKRRTQ